MKKMLIAGNWKMNTNVFESEKLAQYILGFLKSNSDIKSEVLICPPFTSLYPISKLLDGSALILGSQNCHFEQKGAFTGEVSIEMLDHCGVSHIIIGHSERRAYFAEDDSLINKKLRAILNFGKTPILCIGETLEERNSGRTFDILSAQLNADLEGVGSDEIEKIVVAYEPVWAIGTGVSASTEQVVDAHNWLRDFLVGKFGEKAGNVALLYGGSLNEKNADELLAIDNVNGGLIGGASLKGESFVEIIKTAQKYI